MPLCRTRRASLWVLGLAISTFTTGAFPVRAQTASENQVKAAYIYSFAKFIEWPSRNFSSAGSPIRFCVLDDRSFLGELERLTKDNSVAGRPIEVILVHDVELSRHCQLLFMGSAQERLTKQIIAELQDASVLTIGETRNFVEQGGMIGFVVDHDHVHFEINHKAATASGLYISSRLLGVAKRVIE